MLLISADKSYYIENIKEWVHMEYKFSDLTDNIIHCFYKVYNKLGYGFLEKVYENSLKFELVKKI